MTRRGMIGRGLRACVGLIALAVAPKTAEAIRHRQVARRMIIESGDWWLTIRDRYVDDGIVVVGFDDGVAVEVRRVRNHWGLAERPLTDIEVRDIQAHKRQLSRVFRCVPQIGSPVPDCDYKIRAWIKNGRYPGWIMSVEKVT